MTKLCLFVLLWLLLLCLSVERGGRSVDMTVGSLHFIKRPIYLQNNNLKQTNIDLFWYQLHLEVWLMWMNYDSRSSLSHLCLFLPRRIAAEHIVRAPVTLLIHRITYSEAPDVKIEWLKNLQTLNIKQTRRINHLEPEPKPKPKPDPELSPLKVWHEVRTRRHVLTEP